MKFRQSSVQAFFGLALCSTALFTANAQTQAVPSAVRGLQPSPKLTRSEVLADLQIWRESGLASMELDPTRMPFSSPAHKAARARYEQMRASPEFAALVQAIADRRGEMLSSSVTALSRGAQ